MKRLLTVLILCCLTGCIVYVPRHKPVPHLPKPDEPRQPWPHPFADEKEVKRG